MLTTRIAEVTGKLEQHKEIIDTNHKSYNDMKVKKDDLQNERSALWRQENVLQQELAATKEELSKKEQALRSMTGKVG